ncbi:Der GTPase-activating protein YihI [Alteromonas confluentis]|uniref:Der GTPase-activating protein YihI n=1 Tax=Alteromonas confluentis TaxID=1656094 RepID=A0A1E7ZDG9_9ALTE|nr:Der GTPase-activating protein YihI [Alteromonas confluentis]OFC71492.1 GTPase-activating protein [Alteromonas confluentis]
MSSRSKKTRKVGLIGVRKDPDFNKKKKQNTTSPAKSKKHSGNKAGSRNAVESKAKQEKRASGNKDPRHGSKKPIELIKAPVTNAVVKKYATPADELAALEADNRLATLLDKLDDGIAISKAEQAYVDEKMARHRIICDLLGITDSDDEEEDEDPMKHLDAISMDEFKD